jgi:hypothetical protein
VVGMVDAVDGIRRGPLVVFTDPEGGRHAVRISAVIVASDVDQSQDATLLQLPGNRAVSVRMPLDAVLDWFVDASAPPRTTRDVVQSTLSMVNLRHGFAFLLELLLSDAVVSPEELAALRAKCLGAASCVAPDGTCDDGPWVLAAARDLQKLFEAALPGGMRGAPIACYRRTTGRSRLRVMSAPCVTTTSPCCVPAAHRESSRCSRWLGIAGGSTARSPTSR